MSALRIVTVNNPWKGLVWLLLLFFSGCYAGDPPYTAYYTYVQYRAPSAQEWQQPPSVKNDDPLPPGEYALVVTRFSPPQSSGKDGEVGGSKCPMTQVITSVVLTVHFANDVTDNDYVKKPEYNWLKLKRFTCTTNYSPLTLWLIHTLVPSEPTNKQGGIDANSRVSLLRQLLKPDPEEQLPQEHPPQSTRLIRVHRLLEKEKLSQEQVRDLGDFFDPNTAQKDPSLKALQSSVATTIGKTDAQDPHGTKLFSAFARQVKGATEDTSPGDNGQSDAKKNDGHQGAQDAANAPKLSNDGSDGAGKKDSKQTPKAAGRDANATPTPPADTGSHENKNEGYSTTTIVLFVGILLSLMVGLLAFVLGATSQGGAQRKNNYSSSIEKEDPYHVDHEDHASQDRIPSVSRSFWAGFHPHRGAIQAEPHTPVEPTHKAGLEERVSQLESYHIKTMSSIKAQENTLRDELTSLRGELDAWRNDLSPFVRQIQERIIDLEQKSSNTTTGYDQSAVDARVTHMVRKELDAVIKQVNKLATRVDALESGKPRERVREEATTPLRGGSQELVASTSLLSAPPPVEIRTSAPEMQYNEVPAQSIRPSKQGQEMDDLVKTLITIEALTQRDANDLRQNASTACEFVSRWVADVMANNQSPAMYRRCDNAIRQATNNQVNLIVDEGVDLDPDRHRVFASERVDRGTLNRILVLVLPGVECNGRVVRKASVVVSR